MFSYLNPYNWGKGKKEEKKGIEETETEEEKQQTKTPTEEIATM